MKMKNYVKKALSWLLCVCMCASLCTGFAVIAFAESETEIVYKSYFDKPSLKYGERAGFNQAYGGRVFDSEGFTNSAKRYWTSKWTYEECADVTKTEGLILKDAAKDKYNFNTFRTIDSGANLQNGDALRITLRFQTKDISKINSDMQFWINYMDTNGSYKPALFAIRNGLPGDKADGSIAKSYQLCTASGGDAYYLVAADCSENKVLENNSTYNLTIDAQPTDDVSAYNFKYTLKDTTNNKSISYAKDGYAFNPADLFAIGMKIQSGAKEDTTSTNAGSGETFIVVESINVEKAVEIPLPTATFTPANGAQYVSIDTDVSVRFDKEVEDIYAEDVTVVGDTNVEVESVTMDSDSKGALIKLPRLSEFSNYTVKVSYVVQKGGEAESEYSTSFSTGSSLYVGELVRDPKTVTDELTNIKTKTSADYAAYQNDVDYKTGKIWAYSVPVGDKYKDESVYYDIKSAASDGKSMISTSDGKITLGDAYFFEPTTDIKTVRQAISRRIPVVNTAKHENLTVSMDIKQGTWRWLGKPQLAIALAKSGTNENRLFYVAENGNEVRQGLCWGRWMDYTFDNLYNKTTPGIYDIVRSDSVAAGWRTGDCRLTASIVYDETSEKYTLTNTLTSLTDSSNTVSTVIDNIDPSELAKFDSIRIMIKQEGTDSNADNRHKTLLTVDNLSVLAGDGKDALITGNNMFTADYVNSESDAKELRVYVAVYDKQTNALKGCEILDCALPSGSGVIELPKAVITNPDAEYVRAYFLDSNLVPLSFSKSF